MIRAVGVATVPIPEWYCRATVNSPASLFGNVSKMRVMLKHMLSVVLHYFWVHSCSKEQIRSRSRDPKTHVFIFVVMVEVPVKSNLVNSKKMYAQTACCPFSTFHFVSARTSDR